MACLMVNASSQFGLKAASGAGVANAGIKTTLKSLSGFEKASKLYCEPWWEFLQKNILFELSNKVADCWVKVFKIVNNDLPSKQLVDQPKKDKMLSVNEVQMFYYTWC